QELLTEDGTLVWRGKQQLWGREEGRQKDGAPTCRLRFPGQYDDDESGLFYNRFRYYDCDTGQYLSADPVGLLGGVNPYGYVTNPLKWIDPLGLTKILTEGSVYRMGSGTDSNLTPRPGKDTNTGYQQLSKNQMGNIKRLT
ncbi:RHS repeat-associated core domain-containing protein, partial [Yokenella regensburgei]|uniref:RHS repeat-associated core domain-containing protein n=1 Tax=Yokenella regensburgei TaxID=158877 RepID=UPI003F5CD024